MDTAERYRSFAEAEVRGYSPCYGRWGLGIAGDAELLGLIDTLPVNKRQPNLIFGAARYLGVRVLCPFEEFKDFLISNWAQVRDVAMTRRTQTNEVGRTAALLPVLSGYGSHPVALIEFGASAGLCLYPDRYSYRYNDEIDVDPRDGRSSVVLPCATSGNPPLPAELPNVVYRAGIDLNPLDVSDSDDMRWLESLVWPEQRNRLERLRNAAAIARKDPPHLVQGDLMTGLAELVRAAPADIPVIVFGSAVLVYLPRADRLAFPAMMREIGCEWVTNEAPGVIEFARRTLPPGPSDVHMVVSSDGVPVAYARPHGQTLDWFGADGESEKQRDKR
ncbi:DUF2332 family protein [Nocardia sp. ET3-3]|uniref:DUF2332 family protein n=1 Tax=Nocardia terrae TaxID=2675851 RepID=A0A7K1UPQ4_9NOCA|nr:DUF2332 domain-containing protein [Nocardia terrae]MVU76323.1 DUF2332 family protein [Nocardia terrae]